MQQSAVCNRLLKALSDDDFALLAPDLEPIALPRGSILVEPDVPSPFVFFLESGIASQIASTPEQTGLEIGIYGREGVGPAAAILGVERSAYQHIMQGAGEGFRISFDAFTKALEQSRSLLRLFMRYLQVATTQTAYTAVSNGSEVLGERLARWLLMCHDRIDGNELSITHEILGIMLGVRRSSVTDTIHILEGRGVIKASRARIIILDRESLQTLAGATYGVPEAEYERLIGPFR